VTEPQWLACDDIAAMLRHLGRASSVRKKRLFAVACCRAIWNHFTTDQERTAVEVAERYADGDANAEERDRASDGAWDLMNQLMREGPLVTDVRHYAHHAAIRAIIRMPDSPPWLGSDASEPARHVVAATRWMESHQPVLSWEDRPAWNELVAAVDAEERPKQCSILREIVGNPFRPSQVEDRWRTANVVDLARTIYELRSFDRMPILGDTLLHTGCNDRTILEHCRQDGHVRGCWLIDLLLDRG
jgi:hypothetical protein